MKLATLRSSSTTRTRIADHHFSADYADFTNRFLGSRPPRPPAGVPAPRSPNEDGRGKPAQQEETRVGERESETSVGRWARDPKVGPFRTLAPPICVICEICG